MERLPNVLRIQDVGRPDSSELSLQELYCCSIPTLVKEGSHTGRALGGR
jgi:hypothetical protein